MWSGSRDLTNLIVLSPVVALATLVWPVVFTVLLPLLASAGDVIVVNLV